MNLGKQRGYDIFRSRKTISRKKCTDKRNLKKKKNKLSIKKLINIFMMADNYEITKIKARNTQT